MSQPIRVAMLIQRYHPLIGGAERQLAALAPFLKAQGVEPYIVTRRHPGLTPFEVIEGVPVHRLPLIGPKAMASFMFTLAALALLRRLRPHVVHAHGLLSPATTAMAAKRLLNVPIAVKLLRGGNLGDLDKIKHKPFWQYRVALFRQQIDAFITISSEIEAELADGGVLPERRIFIPNGVDLERFKPLSLAGKQALRSSLGLPDGPITIFTGRLDPEKRVDHLIAIWPSVRSVYQDARLLVAGSGAEEDGLRQAAGAGVQFLGRVDNVAPYLQAADLFVLPSITEGLSNALLEALAVGLPVITTAVGGTPDVIDHHKTGWLIQPDDPAALRQAVLSLLSDTALRGELGRCGRDQVVKNYALPVTAERLVALYQQLIAGQPLAMTRRLPVAVSTTEVNC